MLTITGSETAIVDFANGNRLRPCTKGFGVTPAKTGVVCCAEEPLFQGDILCLRPLAGAGARRWHKNDEVLVEIIRPESLSHTTADRKAESLSRASGDAGDKAAVLA